MADRISAIISQEAGANVTAAELADFRARTRLAAKRGGYGVCRLGTGGSGQPACVRTVIRSYSGRVQFPVKSLSWRIVLRSFTFGSILADYPTSCWSCSTESGIINNHETATGEIFRTQIRSALATY